MKQIRKGLSWINSANTAASAVAYTLSGRIFVLAMNFATGIMMARLLGPAGRGAASAISLWPVLISSLVTLGIPVALRYHIRRRADNAEQLFSVALIVSASLGLSAFAIGIVFIPFWLGRYPHPIVRFAQEMMFFAPFMTVNALLQGFLESKGQFTQSSKMVYIPPAGTLVTLVALYAFRAINVFTVPLAYEAPFAFITIVTLYSVRRSIRAPSDFIRRTRLLLHFGLRAYGLDVLNTLSTQVGQVVVIGLLSVTSFGLYTVALSASRTLAILGGSLNTILFPKATELERNEAVLLVTRAARIVFAANFFVGLAMICIMPFLIRLAYGNAYISVTRLVQFLICEVILYSTASTLSQAFMAVGRPGLVTVFQAIGLGASFPLMLLFIPRFGIIGAAYALLASTSLRVVLILASYPLFLHQRMPRLLLTRQDVSYIRARLHRAAT